MPLSATPNMGLVRPEVGPSGTLGPAWAQLLNDALATIDLHDHSSGKGKAIGTSGIAVDADFELNGFDLSEASGAYLQDQVANRAGSGLLYRVGENLVWNNGSGAVVPITNGTAVNNTVNGAFSASTPGAYPYTVSASDAQKVLRVNTSAARTINLPAATTSVLFIVKDITGNAQTNVISIVPDGTNTIDGTAATRQLAKNFGMWIFVSDGVSDWSIGEMTPDVQPIGTITMFAGPTAPGGWLLCQGQAISRSTYSNLFGVMGTAYGVGDGSTTFNLPDLRQRFPLGLAASGTGSTLGAAGGTIDHTHAVPGHHHAMGTGADLNITNSGAHTHSIDHDHSSFTSAAESGHTHTIDHDHSSFTSAAATATTQGTAEAWTGSGTPGGDSFYNANFKISGAIGGNVNQPWGGHTHAIDIPNYTGASGASSGHTHSIDVPNFSGTSGSTAHTHAAGNFAGRIGLVTAGSDGNAAFNTDAKNPPFQVVNYIIKF